MLNSMVVFPHLFDCKDEIRRAKSYEACSMCSESISLALWRELEKAVNFSKIGFIS